MYHVAGSLNRFKIGQFVKFHGHAEMWEVALLLPKKNQQDFGIRMVGGAPNVMVMVKQIDLRPAEPSCISAA